MNENRFLLALRLLPLLPLSLLALSCAHTVQPPPLSVPVVAALYTESDSLDFGGGMFLVSGRSWSVESFGDTLTDNRVLGIATTGDPERVVSGLNHQQMNNVEGLGAWPSVGHTEDLVDIGELAHRYAEAADIELTAEVYSETDWGDVDDFRVTWATGDLRLGAGVAGAGVLVVDGDLICSDGFVWRGPVIVRGDLYLASGASFVRVYGTILVEGDEGPQTISGSVDLFYSSEAIRRVNALNESRPGLENLTWEIP